MHPTRKTAGIRVPDSIIAQSLIEAMGNPIISITAKIDVPEENDFSYLQPDEIIDIFINLVDVVVCTDEYHFIGESTVIDMLTDEFSIIRQGAGYEDVAALLEL
ncbi:putative protein YciO [bioreactor metagenome]|uniref:YrdC-like domain-containing protein n=1 Tax=bioreactor metagenome TaxID=1076179 RepID=A0A645FWY9_9ZZZZ